MVRFGRFLLLLASALSLHCAAGFAQDRPGACKAKTAGFYLQYPEYAAPKAPVASAPGMLVSLTGTLGDPVRGRQTLIDKSKGDCLSCHKLATVDEPDQGEVGPPLDGVGSRYSEGQLRQMLVDPKAIFPDTIMPSFHTPDLPPEASLLTASEVEDLVAFLKSLK